MQLAVRDGLEAGFSEYSQLSPCGHSAITDTSIKRTAANSQAKTNYRRLTEINSRYYGHSLMRTLPRGPSSVRYKGSWLERVQRSNRSATLPPSLQYTYVYYHLYQDSGVNTIAVGVGNKVTRKELTKIAMNRPERVIQRPTIDDPNLIEDLRNMIEDICWTPSRNQFFKQGSNSTDIFMGQF